MKYLKNVVLFLSFLAVGCTALFGQGYIVNGNMMEWNEGKALPEGFSVLHPKATQTIDAEAFFAKDPMGYKGEKHALKMFRNHSNAPSGRFFITPYAFLEDGTYVLTFYLKGNGWLRSVNLATENGMPSTASGSYDETYIWLPMGNDTDFKNQTTRVSLSDWKKYTFKYTVKQGTYCVGICHNNYLRSGVTDTLRIANMSLRPYEPPRLSGLKIGGKSVSFSPVVYTYDYKLPYNNGDSDFPEISYQHNEDVRVVFTPATSLSGNEAARTATIKVVSVDDEQDFSVYKVVFRRAGGVNNAQLDRVVIDGVPVPEFTATRTVYSFCLPYTTQEHPVIEPSTFAENATVSVIPASNIRGTEEERTARVQVTSEDRTATSEYRFTFEVIPELDLILAIGQSNMAGRGVLDPQLDMEPVAGAWLFDLNDQWKVATNPMNQYSEIKDPKKYQGMNPSYTVAKKLAEVTGRNMGMIVNARGATTMEAWQKDAPEGYYASSIRRAKEAQRWGRFKAVIWHQGEGNISRADKYPDQLKKLVGDIRADLNEPELFFVAGQLSHWRTGTTGTNTAKFNAMIDTISQFLPFSGRAHTEGLQPIVTSTSNGLPDYSDPHFDRESQLILGGRYADIILDKVYGVPSTSVKNVREDHSKSNVYVRNRTICVENNPSGGRDSSLLVTDMVGRKIVQSSFSGYAEVPISMAGVYIVSVDQINFKVFVKD